MMEEEKIMQRGTAAPIVLVVVLIVIGLVGISYFGLNKQSVMLSPKASTPNVLAQDSKTLTYDNQKLGFKFEYTSPLSVKEDSEEDFNKRGNGDYRKNFSGYVGYEPGEVIGAVVVLDKTNSFDSNPFSVWVFNNQGNINSLAWFEKYWYYPFLWGVFDYTSKGHVRPDKEATISGQLAEYKVISYQPGSPKFLLISKDQKMYLFRVMGVIGEKILSGFKFN